MYDRLKYMYGKKIMNEKHLEVAVSKGWITEEEKQQIIDAVKTT